MSLPKRLNPDKTTFLNTPNGLLPLSSFPETLVQEFAVLDKMKQEFAELTYKVEVMGLAIKAKGQEVAMAANAHIKSTTADVKDEQTVVQDAAAPKGADK